MSLTINKSITRYFLEKEIEEKVWRDDFNDGRCATNFSGWGYQTKKIKVEISQSEYYKYKKEGKVVFTEKDNLTISIETSIKYLLNELKSLEDKTNINSCKRKIRIADELIRLYQLQIDDIRNELNNIDISLYSDKFLKLKNDAIETLESKINDMLIFSENIRKELIVISNNKSIKKLQLEKKKLLKERMETLKRIDDRLNVIEEELKKF